jgi:hypothetical protein
MARENLLPPNILSRIPRGNLSRWGKERQGKYELYEVNLSAHEDLELIRAFSKNKPPRKVFSAQEVVKSYMEKKLDHRFHANSYGYRPMKSSHAALEEVRVNCLSKGWVVDLDISQFFDTIDHTLMLQAVEWVQEERWVQVYIKRWLEVKIQRADGSQYDRGGQGTP